MEKLKIEYMSVDNIKPYKNNAKLHPEEQIEQIKKSIQEFGMNDPIGIWKDEVVEGHGRLIACKELGITEVPIIRLDHLTDEQRKAYTLAHNKLTMNSGFDIDILNSELDSILDINMEDFELFQENFITDLLEDSMYKTGSVSHNNDFFEYSLTFPMEFKDKFEKYLKDNKIDRRYFEGKIMEEVNKNA